MSGGILVTHAQTQKKKTWIIYAAIKLLALLTQEYVFNRTLILFRSLPSHQSKQGFYTKNK